MQNKQTKFISFLESLKFHNPTLIEAIQQGFNVCYENSGELNNIIQQIGQMNAPTMRHELPNILKNSIPSKDPNFIQGLCSLINEQIGYIDNRFAKYIADSLVKYERVDLLEPLTDSFPNIIQYIPIQEIIKTRNSELLHKVLNLGAKLSPDDKLALSYSGMV